MKKIYKIFIVLVSICIVMVAILSTTNKDDTNKNPSPEINHIEKDNEANLEITEKKEATYEKWLAAAMIKALTLQEDTFQIEHIYFNSSTEIAKKMDSNGAYIVYSVEGEMRCKYSKPLEKEDTSAGTINLYTKDLGFSTFEQIDYKSMQFHSYTETTMKDLKDLIAQSLLVSLYEN